MKIYLSFFIALLIFQNGIAQEVTNTIPNDAIYKFVEQMPVFGNCDEFMVENERNVCSNQQLMLYILGKIKIPENTTAKNLKIGDVMVRFVVDENGVVQNPRMITGINKEFDAMYLEIIKKMPRWTAGQKDEKKVKVEITLPMKVHF